ncbi:E3 ubiquitin-protein ligase TRIM23-like isoform X2 [Rhopilema esculentum]
MLHGDKVPRLLSCGHSLCHECLSKLSVRGQVLLCPFDREPTNVGDSGIWGLKKNFALLDLLERLQLERKEHETSHDDDEEAKEKIRCDENEKHLASIYCLVCSTHLCEECSKNTHSTKTLSKHKRVPLCEKPKGNPPCPFHPSHVLEFTCLEEGCRETPLMCYICKDYGRHQGHKHSLLETEAERVRSSVQSAIKHVKKFYNEVSDYTRRLVKVINEIEGSVIVREDESGMFVSDTVLGSAEDARIRVRAYFDDLRDTINKQEEAGLSVVNNYVREKLCSLRQQQEDIAVFMSQMSAVCADCETSVQKNDAEVIQARTGVLNLLGTVQEQQRQFVDLAELCNEGSSIPVAFTKDNRVHIGPKMEMRVVALGLDNAGKTSILFKLKQDEFVSTITTIGFNVEVIEHKSMKFTIWDVGGLQKLRPLWRHYYLNTQAVIFVVDSANRERINEAHEELAKLMAEKRLKDALILVFANKQDVATSLGVEELSERLGLHKLCCGRSWNILGSDAHSGKGLQEGLDWMARQLMSEFAS